MYHNFQELLILAEERDVSFSDIILENEIKQFGKSMEEVFERLEMSYQVMEQAAEKALHKKLSTVGGLIEGITMPQYRYAQKDNTLCGNFINLVMARALSCSEVNASMGRICAAPTAGACGILPAVLVSLAEKEGYAREKVLRALMTASGVGAIIMRNATVAGAEGGCQAECGVAAAMAAAAAVELKGGTCDMILNAIAITFMNCMGLVCDPVAGLVQLPCAQRNASQTVNALTCIDLAMAGMTLPVTPDEVIESMYKVGRMLPPQLRETAQGGIAATQSAQEITQQIFS